MECPLCKTELEVTYDYASLVVQCPVCGDFFKVPSIQECPKCLKRSFEKRTVCEECGYDFTSVKKLMETGGEEAGEKPALPQRILNYLIDACPGLFHVSPLIAFLFALIFLLVAAVVGAFVFVLGAFFTAFGILIAGLFVYLHGVAALCTGSICGLKSAFEELRGPSWEMFTILGAAPVLLGFAAMGIAKYMMPN